MNFFKKILIIICFVLTMFLSVNVVNAKNLTLDDGTVVKYKYNSVNVTIPDTYTAPETEFRGVWVTPYAGNVSKCTNSNVNSYKQEMMQVFDIMDYYNLNALIFHVRIVNDAFYTSTLNPKSVYMSCDEDVLKWVIDECHKRGFEFHAWMNPYRVNASATSIESITEEYQAKCPANPASNADNLIAVQNSKTQKYNVILNPGLKNVRDFLVNTCMEVVQKYDVDAIHFDDYFYIDGYSDSTSADWKRSQVDTFIEDLHNTLTAYNTTNNKHVQLGISPSGCYRNGNGNVTYDENGFAVTNGSKTSAFAHYGSYLYSDTLKWANKGWIDYLLPQTYWAINRSNAEYCELMDWWNRVFKNLKCNLYSGIGIYMGGESGNTYGWGSSDNEAYNQIYYTNSLDNAYGVSFYSIAYLKGCYNGSTKNIYDRQMKKVHDELYTSKTILPIIRTFADEVVNPVTNFNVSSDGTNTTLTFDAVNNAKFYVIYRSTDGITYTNTQIYDIIGNANTDGKVTFVDKNTNGTDYIYAVKTQGGTNKLSTGVVGSLKTYTVTFKDENGTVLKQETVKAGGSATAPEAPVKSGCQFIGWSESFTNVSKDLVITPKYNDSTYTVKFYNGSVLLKTVNVNYGDNATAPKEPTKTGYTFSGWDVDFTNVKKDLNVYAQFSINKYTITFKDYDGKDIDVKEFNYNENIIYPNNPSRENYKFTGWDKKPVTATSDMVITAQYEIFTYTVEFYNNVTHAIIKTETVEALGSVTAPEPEEIRGYIFKGFKGNYKNIVSDVRVILEYEEIEYTLNYYTNDNELLDSVSYFLLDEYKPIEAPAVEGLTFVKWDFDVNDLDNEKTTIDIYPIYTNGTTNVIFKDSLGNVIATVDMSSGKLEYPKAPIIENYTFVKWSKELKDILPGDNVTAIYKQYTITFVGYDNKVISTDYLTNGAYNKVYPECPITIGYKQVGWDKSSIINTFEDVTVKGVFVFTKCTVNYYDDDGFIYTEDVEYGDKAKSDFTIPTKDGYKFDKFSENLDVITEDLDVKLIYTKKGGCNFISFTDLVNTFVIFGLIILKKKKF